MKISTRQHVAAMVDFYNAMVSTWNSMINERTGPGDNFVIRGVRVRFLVDKGDRVLGFCINDCVNFIFRGRSTVHSAIGPIYERGCELQRRRLVDDQVLWVECDIIRWDSSLLTLGRLQEVVPHAGT